MYPSYIIRISDANDLVSCMRTFANRLFTKYAKVQGLKTGMCGHRNELRISICMIRWGVGMSEDLCSKNPGVVDVLEFSEEETLISALDVR